MPLRLSYQQAIVINGDKIQEPFIYYVRVVDTNCGQLGTNLWIMCISYITL